jgi:hypothetical protein
MHAVWAVFLLVVGAFYLWWERPALEGSATLQMTVLVQGQPEGTRAALWTGPSRSFKSTWEPGADWRPVEGGRVVLPPRTLPLAMRRFKQGMLLRRTHDLAVLQLQAPDGSRRYFVYDLRQDLAGGLLRMGRPLFLQVSCHWASLKGEAVVPKEQERRPVGF